MNPYNLRLFLLLAICFQFIGGSLQAQELDESNFIRYTRLQGLSNNFVSGIVQDSTGYIWIGTHKGLNRFDGKSFRSTFEGSSHSPLPDNLLVSLHSQESGEIIGATRAGAFAYNPDKGVFRKFIVPCDSSIYFWANHALDIVKDNRGDFVVSTKTGLYVFNDSGRLINRYDHHQMPDVGRIELIFGGWVNVLDNGTTLQQNGLLGSVYDPNSNKIDTLYVANRKNLAKAITDSGGNMKMSWCGPHGELFILNQEKHSIDVANIFSDQFSSSLLPAEVMRDLSWSSKMTSVNDSSFAITCRNSGFYLLHYDPQQQKFTCDGNKYFAGNVCTTIFKDRDGRLWIGTADGLYKQNLHNSFFSSRDLSQQSAFMMNHEIRSIYVENADIILGLQNEGGLVVLDKLTGYIKHKIQFAPSTAFNNTVINIFPYSEDTLWVGTSFGILWLNKHNYHYGRLQVPSALEWTQHINSIVFFEDSRKNIWISFGKLNSLIRYNRSSGVFSDLSQAFNPLLKITYVFSMAEDLQGNIWLAGDGICRWNARKQIVDTLIPFPQVSRMLRNYMYILDRDDNNNLWLSSFDNEIIQFNCSTNTMYLREEENSQIDGNTVTNSPIINNNIWMGTDNGISAFNINNYSVRQFTYADGLPSVAITTLKKASFYDKLSNRFYLGARHRLISFVPDATLLLKTPPALFIAKVNTRDSLALPLENDIHLPYSENDISILFNTINFTDPEENRFAWRSLDNADRSWNELVDETGITLTNLSGGWHAYQIKLYSANNHWPQQLRTVRIYIRPPFWKTSWFLALLIMSIAALVIVSYRSRINSVRNKEREKAHAQRLIAEEYKNRLELEQIINYFSTSLKDKTEIDDVVWDVAQNLISRFGYADCVIYLWNRDKTKMLQKAAYGPKGTPDVLANYVFDVAPGQGLVGHVMITKQPILVPDTRKDSRYRVDDVFRLSEISVPIMYEEELIGVIDSEHHVENYFKEKDLKILTTVATLVANKIKQIESELSLEIQQKEIVSINQQLAEARLSALQTQMNPHFIFNCLNSIKGMILNDEQIKASRYLSKFANMIRITLNQSKEVFTTLFENIEHLQCYLEMEKLRFDDSFGFRIIVEDNIDKEETLIPTLMIQPLAENAIWHGLMNKDGNKKLTIRFSRRAGVISCSIEDNGIGINRAIQMRRMNKSPHQSVGLTNLRNRIKIMNEKYDLDCSLVLTDLNEINTEQTGTCALLQLNVITNKLCI